MKTFLTLILLLVGSTLLALDELAELKTLDGKTYKQVKVTKVSPGVEIRIMHAEGLAAIPLSKLPPEVLARYGRVDMTAEARAEAERKLNDMRSYTEGQAAKGERLPAPTETQIRQSQSYAQKTGNSYEACLQAVRVGDWCVAHPKGGTIGGVHYDVQAVDGLLIQAMKTVGMNPSAAVAPVPVPAVRVAPVAGVGVISSSVNGEFTGFEGEKVFQLLNGQVWQQMDFTYHYHYAYGPQVIIYPAGGGMMMKVDGVEKAVRVMQLR